MSKLKPSTTVSELARHELLDALNGTQLVVYLRLIAETARQKSRIVHVHNHQLYRQPRSAIRALQELRDMGLVKLSGDQSVFQRRIEVV